MMQVLVPFGTRPEIVKLAPVVAALKVRRLVIRTVATGQHHDASMAGAFFDDLGLHPDVQWRIDGDGPGRLGGMMEQAEREVTTRRPDVVMVLGDTTTVPVFALAARRHRVPVVHLEAGLRSFNPASIEEVHRRMAAAMASLHLAPTELARRFLLAEGIDARRVRVVGNPAIDVLRRRGAVALPPGRRSGVVVTAHRPTNVDDPRRLGQLVELVAAVAARYGPVTFPVHPRTQARLDATGLAGRLVDAGVHLLGPMPYDGMLDLVARSRVVLTDSGGLQEEAAWFGVPVVVMRHSTPRWEGVVAGTSVLSGLDPDLALRAVARFVSDREQARVAAIPCPYGDGHTAERVADILADPETVARLRLDEPDGALRLPAALRSPRRPSPSCATGRSRRQPPHTRRCAP